MTREEIGQRVRKLRLERGLPQHVLADRALVSYETVLRTEKGRCSPTVETFQMILNGLGITLEDFFKGDITGD